MRYSVREFNIESCIHLPCQVTYPVPASSWTQEYSLTMGHELDPADLVANADKQVNGGVIGFKDRTGRINLHLVQYGIWMRIDLVARHISVIFDQGNPDMEAIAGLYVTGLGLSICSLLNGVIPLHAGAVEYHGGVFGFLAPAGTGKSTLTAALVEKGLRFFADDVLAVAYDGANMIAIPNPTLPFKLWQPTIDCIGIEDRVLQSVIPGLEKYWVPVESDKVSYKPMPLTALFILQPRRAETTTQQLEFRQLERANTITALVDQTHGFNAAHQFADPAKLLEGYLRIQKNVPIYSVVYNRSLETFPGLVSDIIQFSTNLEGCQ